MEPLFVPEPSNRVRVILNTDAKNEADDQYAIVHAILTPLFELHGIIPAHFGDRRGPGSLQASHQEVLKLLDLMGLQGRIPVRPGAVTMLPNEKGPLGEYLVEQLVEWNKQHHLCGPIEHRSLGDSPAVGVMMYPECGWFEWRPAPEFTAEMNYLHTGRNRPIRVYHAIDQRFILEDFFAELARWHRQAP